MACQGHRQALTEALTDTPLPPPPPRDAARGPRATLRPGSPRLAKARHSLRSRGAQGPKVDHQILVPSRLLLPRARETSAPSTAPQLGPSALSGHKPQKSKHLADTGNPAPANGAVAKHPAPGLSLVSVPKARPAITYSGAIIGQQWAATQRGAFWIMQFASGKSDARWMSPDHLDNDQAAPRLDQGNSVLVRGGL